MALTDFSALPAEQLTLWAKELFKVARKHSVMEKFIGTDAGSMVQRVTEFRKNEKGARAIITLVPDVGGNGIVGDNQLEGNESQMDAYDLPIEIDQLRNAVKRKGRMADQKSVVNFRKEVRDSLGYWMARTRDELMFLTASGIPFSQNTNGSVRTFLGGGEDDLTTLAFANDVTAPSSKRIVHLGAGGAITDGAGTNAPAGTIRKLTYADVVNLKAIAKERGIKPIRSNGEETYHLFLTPTGMAQLKLDADFIANVRHAGVRGDKNSLFKGTSSSVYVDGIMVHECFYVYNTRGAVAPNKFGATGADEGQRALLMGAQALAVADIGDAFWNESDDTDYGNRYGIGIGKIFGVRKPVFKGSWDDPTNNQDFGILAVDTAL